MPANTIIVNNHIEFVVPDSKMPPLMDILYSISTQGKNWEVGKADNEVEPWGKESYPVIIVKAVMESDGRRPDEGTGDLKNLG